MNDPELNNAGQDNEAEHPSPSIAKRIGQTTLGILAAYVGLKIGEDIFSFVMPYYEEMGVATAVGSVVVNARVASK